MASPPCSTSVKLSQHRYTEFSASGLRVPAPAPALLPARRMAAPAAFLKGIALSTYQNSGDKRSNWTDFIVRRNYLGQKKHAPAFAKAADFWNMYETDIKMAADLGATSFRVSFEWARFQPDGPDQMDTAAITRFGEILDCIKAHNMEPVVTLHHFVHPSWFENMGGFTKEENLHYFEAYCKGVFKVFGPHVTLWSTFNEPTCFAFVGYIVGLWAPGKLMRLNLAGKVLANLLKAHCRVYRALKQMPGGQVAQVGLVHQHIKFLPRHNLPHVRAMCKWMTFWFGTYSVLTFFETGTFAWDSPMSTCKGPKTLFVDEGVANGERVLDWWGINYYSRPCVHWNLGMGPSAANEPCSDTHFRLYPQGLYDSIRDASGLKVPIYITETGLADKEDKYRGWYIKAIYAMLLKSIADGYDVRGVFWWTLMDNIEWHEGFDIKFGLYQWDPEYATLYKDNNNRPPGGVLRLREGSKSLAQLYHTWPDNLEDLRAYAREHASEGIPPFISNPAADAAPPPGANIVTVRGTRVVVANSSEPVDNKRARAPNSVEVVASSRQAAAESDGQLSEGRGGSPGPVDVEQVNLLSARKQ